MPSYPYLIDNRRTRLVDILRRLLPDFKKLSIATGYWDLPGTLEIIDELMHYESIRLLIGQEPLSFPGQRSRRLDLDDPGALFPDDYIKQDLEDLLPQQNGSDDNSAFHQELRRTVNELVALIKRGVLTVKIMKKPLLHAKAFIFGDYDSQEAYGIVGSSNFTKAGLMKNIELNSLDSNVRDVTFRPMQKDQPHGHLSWFDEMWECEDAEEWTRFFKEIISNSPFGDMCYGPYDVYIKTLMELYSDELIEPYKLPTSSDDILFAFQNRNAGILINKLEKVHAAMLADSVGLGKTITAGAVMKYYLNRPEGANILVIAPAAIKEQWINDLTCQLHLDKKDFTIISQQDVSAIKKEQEYYENEKRKARPLDLIVIDEAHNLRRPNGARYQAILDLIKHQDEARILLLTATPINNSLMDIVYQIQLALKDNVHSVNVTYTRPDDQTHETIDFFEALTRIQAQLRNKEKDPEEAARYLESVKPTIHEGLRHYLVRSTRKGVATEGSIIRPDGTSLHFPVSKPFGLDYAYSTNVQEHIFKVCIGAHIDDVFESIDPRRLNLDLMSELTQQTSHPLDFIKKIRDHKTSFKNLFGIDREDLDCEPDQDFIINMLQVIFLLGFPAYRPEVYKRKNYGRTNKDISGLPDKKVKIQYAVHNILQVTWLKRLESSPEALRRSLQNYKQSLVVFKKYLDKGYVVSLCEARLLESDYNDGEDIEQAFADYQRRQAELQEDFKHLDDEGKKPKKLTGRGVERTKADPNVFKLEQLQKDIDRDRRIIDKVLEPALKYLAKPNNNMKLLALRRYFNKILPGDVSEHGRKVVVFSFFADTIDYLKKEFVPLMEKEPAFHDFGTKAEFITGKTKKTEDIISRFSPEAKHYTLKSGEQEIDYLFSTDVLSEGQNLQDAGRLINYDLHWNPVRLIQRNGRINRIGSPYHEVLIHNMYPTKKLEKYLRLVRRLKNKISMISNTIGLDQPVLKESDKKEYQFIDQIYNDKAHSWPEDTDDVILADMDRHINHLREFLGRHQEGSAERKRVENIPLGKWNYLPARSKPCDGVLALVEVESRAKGEDAVYTDRFFSRVQTTKGKDYRTDHFDCNEALGYLETTENDNEPQVDRIACDRHLVVARAETAAKRQAEQSPYWKIPPLCKDVMARMKFYLNADKDYLSIVQRGGTHASLRKEFQKYCRELKRYSDEKGTFAETQLEDFVALIKKFEECIRPDRYIENVKGVLYYADADRP